MYSDITILPDEFDESVFLHAVPRRTCATRWSAWLQPEPVDEPEVPVEEEGEVVEGG